MRARSVMHEAVRYFAGARGLSADVNRRPLRAAGTGSIRALVPLLLTLATVGLLAGSAAASTATKRVRYDGYQLRVPASWPVFNLSRAPSTCVRFNRHAVYLGAPAAVQRCPALALGRTEALLLTRAGHGSPELTGNAARLRRGAVVVTATWGSDPRVLRTALHDSAIGRAATTGPLKTVRAALHDDVATAHASPIASAAATIFTGPGFDACEDPSTAQLNAWLASTYRAVGTYIGGANMGCSQPNLSATYVAEAVAAGWHLIPTYVGLQAPTNSCGCSPITASQAATQGAEAAENAVAEAQTVGIGAGNPIYDDMEAYPTGGTNTTTVLTFLSAWTTELHALGYLSGVYSSTDSGIHDLVAAAATPGNPYALPDDLWNADWNEQQSTTDAAIPATEWADDQRIHQNEGAHNETWGAVKMNIDGDYVGGATVGTGNVTAPVSLPTLSIAPQPDGAIDLNGSWSGGAGVAGWRLLGGPSPTALQTLTGPLGTGVMVSHSALPYFSEQALGSAGQVLATSPVTATPSHIAVYGRTVFAPAAGWVGLPVGCFATSNCEIATTVSAGRTVVASSKPERVREGQSGIVFVTMTTAGRRLLGDARGHRLAVTVSAVDGSVKAKVPMTMIPFVTSGAGPKRTGTPSSVVRAVGYTDFVSGGGVGGILTGCSGELPCSVSAALASGHTLLAVTGPEFLGANELGYVSFRLTAAGARLLAKAPGNQLAATLKLSDGSYGSALADIALVRFP
jgi:hypothetical protein